MTDTNPQLVLDEAEEPTFVCLKCLQRFPNSQRHAPDEPFDTACFEANQAEEAERQQAIADAEAAADEDLDEDLP